MSFLSPWKKTNDNDDKDDATPAAAEATPNPFKPLSHSDDEDGDDDAASRSNAGEEVNENEFITLTLKDYQKLINAADMSLLLVLRSRREERRSSPKLSIPS